MIDFDKKLEIAYKCCEPLKIECIKKELDTQLVGYKLENIERQNDEWTVYFTYQNEAHIMLSISSNKFSII